MTENTYYEDDPFYSRDGELVTDILYFQAAYEVTKNPLYIWEAITFANEYGEDIPPFVIPYLVKCAKGIISIEDFSETKKISVEIVRDFMGIKNQNYKSIDTMSDKIYLYEKIDFFRDLLEPKANTLWEEYSNPKSKKFIENEKIRFRKFKENGYIQSISDVKRLVFDREKEETINKCFRSCKQQQEIKQIILEKF